MFWCTKSVKFHFRWGKNRKTKNRRLGTIVTSFQAFKLREKQISPTFSYFVINNAPLHHFLANWLANNKKITEKFVFLRSLKSWNDVAIIPSVLFLASWFWTPPEVKFDASGASKHEEGKSLSKIFAIHINTFRRCNRASKKNLSYTLYIKQILWKPITEFVAANSGHI